MRRPGRPGLGKIIAERPWPSTAGRVCVAGMLMIRNIFIILILWRMAIL